jgi:hypothetical protein
MREEYEIVDTHADNIAGCGICRYTNDKNEGRCRKLDWLKQHYAEGLQFKVLRSRTFGDIGMIEYAPASHAWRPVEADGYLVIHCLMVFSQHTGKGLGACLLDSCLRDAKKRKYRGVAVVTSADSFMAGSSLFLKAGFVSVASDPPYELLVKRFTRGTPDPRFIVDRERALKKYPEGLTILAADQCPMIPKCVKDIAEASKALGLKTKVVRVRSAKESRDLPTPFGVFSIIYNGKVIAERPVSGTRFKNIMSTLVSR